MCYEIAAQRECSCDRACATRYQHDAQPIPTTAVAHRISAAWASCAFRSERPTTHRDRQCDSGPGGRACDAEGLLRDGAYLPACVEKRPDSARPVLCSRRDFPCALSLRGRCGCFLRRPSVHRMELRRPICLKISGRTQGEDCDVGNSPRERPPRVRLMPETKSSSWFAQTKSVPHPECCLIGHRYCHLLRVVTAFLR